MIATVLVREEVLEDTEPSRGESPEAGEEGADDISFQALSFSSLCGVGVEYGG